jgi:type I restriction enzyme S subunit
MTWGVFDEDENKAVPHSKSIDPQHEIRPGDLLLSRSNTAELVGASVLVGACRNKLLLSDKSMRLLVAECIDRRWLQCILSSPNVRNQWSKVATGSSNSMRNISQEKVRAVSLALPPLNEQRRIVAKIEELVSDLDAGVATLERARVNQKRYRAAVLRAAVEGRLTAEWREQHPKTEPASNLLERITPPVRPARYATRSKDIIPGHAALTVGPTNAPLPPGWVWCPLVDVARMESGHTPSRQHPEWWDGDIPWVGILDAKASHGGRIYETLQHTNQAGLDNSSARLLPTGTVTVSRTAASIGYVVVLGQPMATSQDFVSWVPSDAVLSDWLRLIFMVDRGVLVRFGKGSTHKTVYYPEWLSMHVAIPPLAEQEEIVAEVDHRLSIIATTFDALDTQLQRAAYLRQGILKRAFEGQLVRQDPQDEPASVLLERINADRQASGGNGQEGSKPRRTRRADR